MSVRTGTANRSLLEDNLAVLATRDPELARRVEKAPSDRRVTFLTSRNGLTVPTVECDGRPVALHSRYDPILEGQRLAEEHQSGFLVFFGLAAAHHIRPYLTRRETTGALIVLPGVPRLRSLLGAIDLRDIITDQRVHLWADTRPELLTARLLQHYLPLVAGDISVVILPGALRTDGEYYRGMSDAVRRALAEVSADISVQAQFGRRWFANTLANIPLVRSAPLPRARAVVVTAAGPSLERHRALIDEAPFLLATDTSLPAVIAQGRAPNLVISIDCQQISYHHFLSGLPAHTTLALDLASPPLLARRAARTLFLAGGHPLSQYVSAQWLSLPPVDTSGGNVTHAAVSIAAAMGATTITLIGADYGYPHGVPYAGETYFYPYFRAIATRLSPLTTGLLSYVLDRPEVTRKPDGTYQTPRMTHYRTRLLEGFVGYDVKQIGPGMITLTARSGVPKQAVEAAGTPRESPASFLRKYADALDRLPGMSDPVTRHWQSLGIEDRRLWLTIMPVAAHNARTLKVRDALEEARLWCVGRANTIAERA